MAKNSHHDLIGQYTPRHRNHFELQVTGIPGFDTDDGILVISLKSVTLPKEETNVITLPYLNTELHYAGKTTVGQFEAEFYNFCDQDTYEKLRAWRKLVYDQDTQKQGLSSQYKKTGTLSLFSPDFESYIQRWSLIGLWPNSDDLGTADMGSDEQIMIPVGFSADRVKMTHGFTVASI